MNMETLDQAIKDFNEWDRAAWLYYNEKEDYFNTEAFPNDISMTETFLNDDCFVILSKSERENKQIGKVRKQYIIDFVNMVNDGWEPFQAEYKLLDKYHHVI
ncbi:hypothetical protein [Siminovitchia sp. 179-K 8D1 HS]|uniref:hypothetical protein n=1 Tax=Siminovitchia sp. 179-K 8D1 HS TaxID=3142385 RepID=UPI0039A2244B